MLSCFLFFSFFLSFSKTVVDLSISFVALLILCVCAHWCVYLFLWAMVGMWFCSMDFMLLGGKLGHASRRAMLQQLHGVTMYSHDEHHTTTSYCWNERGKGALADTQKHPQLSCWFVCVRPSVRMSTFFMALCHLNMPSAVSPCLDCFGTGWVMWPL